MAGASSRSRTDDVSPPDEFPVLPVQDYAVSGIQSYSDDDFDDETRNRPEDLITTENVKPQGSNDFMEVANQSGRTSLDEFEQSIQPMQLQMYPDEDVDILEGLSGNFEESAVNGESKSDSIISLEEDTEVDSRDDSTSCRTAPDEIDSQMSDQPIERSPLTETIKESPMQKLNALEISNAKVHGMRQGVRNTSAREKVESSPISRAA